MKHLLSLFLLFILFDVSAQSGWYAVPGAPVTGRYEDVSFIGYTGWFAQNNASTFDNVVIYKTTNAGDTWFVTDTIDLNAQASSGARSIEFINDSIGLVGMLGVGPFFSCMYRTSDGGISFDTISSPAFINSTGICGMAHFGNTVIGVGKFDSERKFYKSTDTGLTWNVIQLDPLIVSGLVDCYMFNDSVYVISGRGPDNGVDKAVILKTFDGGLTWQKTATSSAPSSWAWKMHFLENGKGCASIEYSDKIFLTSDSGSTWSEITVGACSPPFEEYGGTGFLNDTLGWVADQFNSTCMKETRDGGVTWNGFSFGQSIDRMVRIDSVTMLAVGITIYKYSFDSVTTFVSNLKGIEKTILELQPNPADNELTVKLNLRYRTTLRIKLMNANHQFIKDLPEEFLSPGEYARTFNTSDLPSGNYLVMAITRMDHVISKVQIVH